MLNSTIKTRFSCIAAGALAIASGCNSMPHRTAANAPATYVPPLSSIAPAALQPDGVAAPTLTSIPNSLPPLIPPPVSSNSLPPFAVPAQVAPVSSVETVAAPSTAVLPPVVMNPNQADRCVPVDPEWKRSLEVQSQVMQGRLNSMDSELAQNRIRMEAVTNQLATSQQKIAQLNQELNHWKGETRRLDSEMQQQQESDLKSLDELAIAVNGLITRQRMAQAGQP